MPTTITITGPPFLHPHLLLTGTACKLRYGRCVSRPITRKGRKAKDVRIVHVQQSRPTEPAKPGIGRWEPGGPTFRPRKPELRWPCDRPCWSPCDSVVRANQRNQFLSLIHATESLVFFFINIFFCTTQYPQASRSTSRD